VESPARHRYDVVECSVIGHVRYGLLIESRDGESGFVDRAHITDRPGESWPAVGQPLRCVVLGYTKEGRLRAAATPLYVEMIAAADDPAAAANTWSLLAGRTG
jgi:hypothetical protein